ncbi:hypothetical protein Trydic_g2221 [Trypoxylus dichotomus]
MEVSNQSSVSKIRARLILKLLKELYVFAILNCFKLQKGKLFCIESSSVMRYACTTTPPIHSKEWRRKGNGDSLKAKARLTAEKVLTTLFLHTHPQITIATYWIKLGFNIDAKDIVPFTWYHFFCTAALGSTQLVTAHFLHFSPYPFY